MRIKEKIQKIKGTAPPVAESEDDNDKENEEDEKDDEEDKRPDLTLHQRRQITLENEQLRSKMRQRRQQMRANKKGRRRFASVYNAKLRMRRFRLRVKLLALKIKCRRHRKKLVRWTKRLEQRPHNLTSFVSVSSNDTQSQSEHSFSQ